MATIPNNLLALLRTHYPILDFDGVLTSLGVDWQELKMHLKNELAAPKANSLFELHFFSTLTGQKEKYLSLVQQFESTALTTAPLSPLGSFIKEAHIRFSLLSNNSGHTLNSFLQLHQLHDFADQAIGFDNVTKLKPDPQGLVYIISKVHPHNPVYIGNQFTDELTATAAKIPFTYYQTV